MTTLIDFAYGRPSPASIKKRGFAGVLRYSSVVAGKCLTPSEYKSYLAAGLEVGVAYEDGAIDFATPGEGVRKAAVAKVHLATLPWPKNRPAYCALDGPATFDMAAAVKEVLAFAAELSRPAATYGARPWLVYAEEHGVRYLWESGASSWNTGPEPSNKRLQQGDAYVVIDGVECDVDAVVQGVTDWGQVPYTAPSPPTPGGKMHKDVVVTVDGAGNGTDVDPEPFAKVDGWSVVGGAGNYRPIVRCQASGTATEVSVQGAAPASQVTVRLSLE